jgi:predicted  nucleic acid-binding Zn-ribbon protein
MEKVKWNDMSNSSIRTKLESMKNEHDAIKSKISSLLENMENIQKEYFIGNKTLIKRIKGE